MQEAFAESNGIAFLVVVASVVVVVVKSVDRTGAVARRSGSGRSCESRRSVGTRWFVAVGKSLGAAAGFGRLQGFAPGVRLTATTAFGCGFRFRAAIIKQKRVAT